MSRTLNDLAHDELVRLAESQREALSAHALWRKQALVAQELERRPLSGHDLDKFEQALAVLGSAEKALRSTLDALGEIYTQLGLRLTLGELAELRAQMTIAKARDTATETKQGGEATQRADDANTEIRQRPSPGCVVLVKWNGREVVAHVYHVDPDAHKMTVCVTDHDVCLAVHVLVADGTSWRYPPREDRTVKVRL